jgi:hypothetical protein
MLLLDQMARDAAIAHLAAPRRFSTENPMLST